eukprot:4217244-Prymnesium_polylepis.1
MLRAPKSTIACSIAPSNNAQHADATHASSFGPPYPPYKHLPLRRRHHSPGDHRLPTSRPLVREQGRVPGGSGNHTRRLLPLSPH